VRLGSCCAGADLAVLSEALFNQTKLKAYQLATKAH
jgi:hypothetical protein